MGHPTVYPTGVTVYDPGKAWNGYTIFPAADLGALLIDMNGSEVQLWRGLRGFPNKLLPNGQVFGSTGLRDPAHGFQDQTDLVQVDWDGNIVWRFSHLEHIADPGQEPRWYARQQSRSVAELSPTFDIEDRHSSLGAALMRNSLLSFALITGLFLPVGLIHAQDAKTVTATCKDGTSFTGAKRSGACRSHGGVQSWGAAPEPSGLVNPATEPTSNAASTKAPASAS